MNKELYHEEYLRRREYYQKRHLEQKQKQREAMGRQYALALAEQCRLELTPEQLEMAAQFIAQHLRPANKSKGRGVDFSTGV